MARELEMCTKYYLVVEIARRIKGYHQRGREKIQQDKRAQFFGKFRGAPARGRGHFERGQPNRPPYSAPPPPPRGAPMRPYFSAMPESSYRPPSIQGSSGGYFGHHSSFSAYYTTMPESSYHSLAIQGSSSRYSSQQSQTSGHQSMAPWGCYECRDPASQRQGLAGRVRPRGGGQTRRGQPATAKSGGSQPAGALTRFYAILARPDVLAIDAVITGIPREPLGTPIYVSTLVVDFVVVDRIYQSCVVTFCGYETRANLLLLDMISFEVILSMDWLSRCHAILDCHAKTVTLPMSELPRLEWKGSSVSSSSQVISFLKAWHLVEKGCLAYLAYVRDTTAESPIIDAVPVVQEFADVFPSDLPGMPLDRDIDLALAYDIYSSRGIYLNLRQRRWLELLKDYDITILCHPGKANMVTDALSSKAESMDSLAFISAEERPLALDIQSLTNRLVRLDISEPSRVLACVVVQSSLMGEIKDRQFNNLHLAVLREMVLQGSAKEVSIGEDGATKMYHDLRKHYWWWRMKKDIVEYAARCLNYQQVKLWVIVDRLTKSAQFIPVATTYTSERAIQSELGTHVELSIAFHPHTDGQSKRTVQILEDMFRACVIDFGGQWDQFLHLVKFAYNKSYQSIIEMDPFDTLYGRRCHSPIGWFEPGEAKLYSIDMVKNALEKQMYHANLSHVLDFSIIQLDESLGYEEEPFAIVDRQDHQLISKRISVVKIQWRGQPVKEATWESQEDMRRRYPHLFSSSGMNLNPFKDERLFKRWRM
ncbi:uncharacterized protein [Nicotiana sylvestris]|uniref:uncharacterized protein n=1 Tax=Nicotiana sylvestris TaxID=4096 RepID=UPI00388CEBFB